ncbi:hypothetical protein [Streptomyces sp. NBC_00211]|uniref:hypothetical protein n=1 Tax=Streptomyces sp. NBC_00211 TaxID=2975683 RepID=UPI00386FFF58
MKHRQARKTEKVEAEVVANDVVERDRAAGCAVEGEQRAQVVQFADPGARLHQVQAGGGLP